MTTTATAPAVAVRELSKAYGDMKALDGVSFSVGEGVICGLLGRNGAGKTTALQLITGHALPSGGSVEVFGRRPFEDRAAMESLCFIREGQCYPENYTVAMVLGSATDLLPGWDADYAAKLIDRFDLPLRRRVRKLSRGMTSALGIVLGLASRAPLTVFDEPYLGLDAVARQVFYDELLADYADHPRTVILSTHLIDEVSDLLEHVVLIDKGQVLLDDTTENLRRRAIVATGPADEVDRLAAERPGSADPGSADPGSADPGAGRPGPKRRVLSREAMGHQARAAIDGGWSDEELTRARAAGIHVEQASLQQLIVGATRGPAATEK